MQNLTLHRRSLYSLRMRHNIVLYCYRWFMDVLGFPKSSAPFLINGVLMTIIFFLIRIVTIPPYWMKVYAIYGTPAYLRLGRIWYVLVSSCIILDYLNLVWFYKIIRGCKKVIWNTVICGEGDKTKKQQSGNATAAETKSTTSLRESATGKEKSE